jgi:filamentous hemagglutinin family protein
MLDNACLVESRTQANSRVLVPSEGGWKVSGAALILLLTLGEAMGEVTTDGSLGPRQALAGPEYQIGEALGQRAGGNLFHSFEYFSLSADESAIFSGASDIDHVISRVTGGSPSSIDGALISRVEGADLYFLNPAGVLFGVNASIDVPASLHVATADELRLADGGRFSASQPLSGNLSAAPPSAFGFVSGDAGPLKIQGEERMVEEWVEGFYPCIPDLCYGSYPVEVMRSTSHSLNPGAGLTLAGGDVVLEQVGLAAPGGGIRITAMGERVGEVKIPSSQRLAPAPIEVHAGGTLLMTNAELGSAEAGGHVALAGRWVEMNHSDILVEGAGQIRVDASQTFSLLHSSLSVPFQGGESDGARSIRIETGDLRVDASEIAVTNSLIQDDNPLGRLTVRAAGKVLLTHGGSLSSLNGGEIFLASRDLHIWGTSVDALIRDTPPDEPMTIVDLYPSGIFTTAGDPIISGGNAPAGAITLDVAGLTLLEAGGEIGSESIGAGAPGRIELTSGELRIDAGRISSENRAERYEHLSYPTETLDGGAIHINIANGIDLNQAEITSQSSGSAGDAGRIRMQADSLTARAGSVISSGVGSEYSRTVEYADNYPSEHGAGSLELAIRGQVELHGSVIDTDTQSRGDAGLIQLEAGSLLLAGEDGSPARISSDTWWEGDAGVVRVHVDEGLELRQGGEISTATLPGALGNAGLVDIGAGAILIDGGDGDGQTGVFSNARSDQNAMAMGDVGDLVINAPRIQLRNGGAIGIQNQGIGGTGGEPHAIRISSDLLNLDRSTISTDSRYSAPAGNIDLSVSQRLLLHHATIDTQATDGDGGAIRLHGGSDPTELVYLTDSRVTTSVRGMEGDGGDIRLAADNMVLRGGFIQANTAARGASGGDIRLDLGALVPWQGVVSIGGLQRQTFEPGFNLIQASAPDGIDGEITIAAPDYGTIEALMTLDTGYAQTSSLFRGPCANQGSEVSRLAWVGSGGLPWRADEPLSATLDGARLQRILADSTLEGDKVVSIGTRGGYDCGTRVR